MMESLPWIIRYMQIIINKMMNRRWKMKMFITSNFHSFTQLIFIWYRIWICFTFEFSSTKLTEILIFLAGHNPSRWSTKSMNNELFYYTSNYNWKIWKELQTISMLTNNKKRVKQKQNEKLCCKAQYDK